MGQKGKQLVSYVQFKLYVQYVQNTLIYSQLCPCPSLYIAGLVFYNEDYMS